MPLNVPLEAVEVVELPVDDVDEPLFDEEAVYTGSGAELNVPDGTVSTLIGVSV